MTVAVDEPALGAVCGSARWVEAMLARAPFESAEALHAAADAAFDELGEQDWLEAFAHHPRIGDVDALRERFAASGAFSEHEQSGLAETADAIIEAIHRNNEDYEAKFGFVFLIRAAGRSAHEILAQQRERLQNDRPRELEIAAGQQREITHLRLDAHLEPTD